MRKAFISVIGVAAAMCVAGVAEKKASASLIDIGAEAGVQKRNLSDTNYKTAFAWQLHAEFALLPPIIMVGPYLTMQTAKPDNAQTSGGDVSSNSFRTIGARAKVKIPIPGGFTPYGVIGAGWVHADFPDQSITKCPPAPAQCPPITPITVKLPNLTANFVEFVIGGGLLIDLAGPLALSLEFNWRPTTGYKNDTYEKQLQSNDPSKAPDPSRNGYSWTAMAGLAIVL